jgi:hypothetical protein
MGGSEVDALTTSNYRATSTARSVGCEGTMNPTYFSALAALVGALIGGLTSFANSWLTQHNQLRFTHREAVKAKREELYTEFVNEASRLYTDAYEHQKESVADLVKLYSLIARMRLASPQAVIVAAEQALYGIAKAYLGPNFTLRELLFEVHKGELQFLRDFGEACRQDLES